MTHSLLTLRGRILPSIAVLTLLSVGVVLVGCNRISSPIPAKPSVEVSPAKFQQTIDRDGLTLVKFGATWCGPCRAVDRELAQLDGKLGEVEVLQIDVDENPGLAQQYRVSGIPKLLLLRSGEVVDEQVGAMSAADITDWVASAQ
ncbi:MAG: thioredoxin family protein [Planctomycetota bacterium]